MAGIALELADCTQEWRPTTASAYLTDLIDRKIVRVSNGQVPGIQLRECFIQRTLIPRVVHFPLETSPSLISHEDLSPDNIIVVDNEYNIKGIIDWGSATLLPLQFAVYFPRILAIEPSPTDAPQPPGVVGKRPSPTPKIAPQNEKRNKGSGSGVTTYQALISAFLRDLDKLVSCRKQRPTPRKQQPICRLLI